MFSFLGFIFIIILVVLLFGISIISTIIRGIFGGRRTNTGNTQSQRNTQSSSRTPQDSYSDARNKERKKVFDKDDGEYVEYEEIKED